MSTISSLQGKFIHHLEKILGYPSVYTAQADSIGPGFERQDNKTLYVITPSEESKTIPDVLLAQLLRGPVLFPFDIDTQKVQAAQALRDLRAQVSEKSVVSLDLVLFSPKYENRHKEAHFYLAGNDVHIHAAQVMNIPHEMGIKVYSAIFDHKWK